MENPRPEKVAVVTEVRERLDAAEAAILTEYRGLTVSELAALARRCSGPPAATTRSTRTPWSSWQSPAVATRRCHRCSRAPPPSPSCRARSSAAAKALRDYARTYPNLVIKGGLHGDGFLSTQDLSALADLPSRDVLLAQLAGAIAAPLRQFAGLLQALPRNLAYGLSALLDQQGGAPAEAAARLPRRPPRGRGGRRSRGRRRCTGARAARGRADRRGQRRR